jgi:Family of unknown function (DUF6879)
VNRARPKRHAVAALYLPRLRGHPLRPHHLALRDIRITRDRHANDLRLPVTQRHLNDPAFGPLFTDISSSWFRLETLQRYDVAYERPDFAAFLRGEQLDTTPGPWQSTLCDHVAAGRTLARVHVLEEPLSDYVRYELRAYVPNAEAGEDVRVIPVQQGEWPEDLPRHDYWLFDDKRLWLMDYDAGGRFQAARQIEDPAAIDQHRRWRDAALAQSIALAEYSTHQPA